MSGLIMMLQNGKCQNSSKIKRSTKETSSTNNYVNLQIYKDVHANLSQTYHSTKD